MLQAKPNDSSGSASSFDGSDFFKAANPVQPILDAAGNLTNIMDVTIDLDVYAKSFANQIGAGTEYSKVLAQYFAQTKTDIDKMALGVDGASIQVNAMASYMKEFGRFSILSEQSIVDLQKNSLVLGVTFDELVSNFASIGEEIPAINDYTKTMAVQARNFGVPLSQVADEVIPNLKKLNEYGFNNGIEGLTKMSIQSRRLKLDMDETFDLASDLFSPEKAFQTAAFFQRMGVVNAELTDAFALQDIARNRVDDLQTAIADMASTYLEFDEETQQFKVPASSVDDLRVIAEETGISYDNLVRSGGELLKMQSKTKALQTSNLDFADSQISALESMLQLTTNKEGIAEYGVTFKDERGEVVTKALSELQQSDKARLEQFLIDQQDVNLSSQNFVGGLYDEQKSYAAQFAEKQKANQDALAAGIAATAGPDVIQGALAIYESTSSAFINNFSLTNDNFRTFLNGFNANLQGVVTSLANADLAGAIGQLTTASTSLVSFAGSAGLGTLTDALSNLTTSLGGFTGVDFSGFQEQINNAKAAIESFTNSLSIGETSLIPQLSLPEINIPSITTEPTSQNTNNTNVNGKVELIFKTDGSFTAKQVDEMAAQLTKSGNAQKLALALEKAAETRTT